MKVQNLIDILQLHCKPDDEILCGNYNTTEIEEIVTREGSVRINQEEVFMFETSIYHRG